MLAGEPKFRRGLDLRDRTLEDSNASAVRPDEPPGSATARKI